MHEYATLWQKRCTVTVPGVPGGRAPQIGTHVFTIVPGTG